VTNSTIINQVAPTAGQPGTIDYQANVEVRIIRIVDVTLEAKLAKLGAAAAVEIPTGKSSAIKQVELADDTTVKEPEKK
jgi:hypothetical protein